MTEKKLNLAIFSLEIFFHIILTEFFIMLSELDWLPMRHKGLKHVYRNNFPKKSFLRNRQREIAENLHICLAALVYF